MWVIERSRGGGFFSHQQNQCFLRDIVEEYQLVLTARKDAPFSGLNAVYISGIFLLTRIRKSKELPDELLRGRSDANFNPWFDGCRLI